MTQRQGPGCGGRWLGVRVRHDARALTPGTHGHDRHCWDMGWIEDLLLVLLGRSGAERLARRANDATEEVVLRLHETIRHLEGGVDDLLPFRRLLAVQWKRLVDALGELADGLKGGLLAALDQLENLLGQLCGLVGDRHLNPCKAWRGTSDPT